MFIFTAVSKKIFHTVVRKLWPDAAREEQIKLGELVFTLVVIELSVTIHLAYRFLTDYSHFCLLSHAGLIVAGFLAMTCTLNRKLNCAMNAAFTVPLLVYFCYISDFSVLSMNPGAIYGSLIWLLAGAFYLLWFSASKIRIILYSTLSVLTLIIQLVKNNAPGYLFDEITFYPAHPVIAFILLIAAGVILRIKYDNTADKLRTKLRNTREEISSTFRDAAFPVAEIKVLRDEAGNVIRLNISKVNHAFESTFNIKAHEVRDQEANFIFELVLKETFDLNKILLDKNYKTREFHARKLDLWFRIHIIKPGLQTWHVIFENITRMKNRMAELEMNKKRYKVLLETIPDMFFVIDKEGVYEDFVIKESDLFKVKDVNIVGSTIFEVGFPANMAEKILDCIHNCLKNNTLETIEYAMSTPNGTYMFEMRLARLDARSVLSVSRDITRRKNAEFSLEKAKVKAEESDRLKSAFLSNLSHEIRTPVNIITNFTRMLTDETIHQVERSELQNAIIQNGNQLLNMIDNTIHLSRIETNGVTQQTEFCFINPLVRDLYVRYKSMIPDNRPVTLKIYLDVPHASFGFETDRQLLTEVLQILTDNAMKYTLEGEISLGYEMQHSESVKFTITDTGIGIPQDQHSYIFSRFYRVKNRINEITSGSGLGLPIAQHYVRLLGGELRFESQPEKGSTFTFTLPFKNGKGFLKIVE